MEENIKIAENFDPSSKTMLQDNPVSDAGEKKYPLLTSQPMMWRDLISPEVHALARKAIRFHMSLVTPGTKKDGEKVGRLMFLFEDGTDAEAAKTLLNRLASTNGAELDRPVKVNLEMVERNSNEINTMEKIDRRNVYIRNLPKNTTPQLLKFLFPKAVTVHIPTEKDGNPARYAIMRCKTNQEARICVDNGNGLMINDTEIILEQRKKSKLGKKNKQSVIKERSDTSQHDTGRSNYRKKAPYFGRRRNIASGRKMDGEFYSGGFDYEEGYY